MKYPDDFVGNIIHGDCLQVIKGIPDNAIDSIITDPPYGLEFMGKDWDKGVPGVIFWKEMLRICKPGSILMAFGGTRTFHRLACAIEDAGWEIRDCISWLYGSGFPKSLDISKAIDKEAGKVREIIGDNPNARPNQDGKTIWIGDKKGKEQSHPPLTAPATEEAKKWNGWGTALKPAWEPIIIAMKSCDGTYADNALKHGVAGFDIDGCRVAVSAEDQTAITKAIQGFNNTQSIGGKGKYYGGQTIDRNSIYDITKGRFPANLILDESYIDIMGLSKNIDKQIASLIKEYFYENYSELSDLQCGNNNYTSVENGSDKILQQEMLLGGTKQENEGEKSPIIRETSYSQGEGKNKEESSETLRESKSYLQGILVREGIQVCESIRNTKEMEILGRNNESHRKRNSRASVKNGNSSSTPIDEKRSNTPQEWDKRRQQTEKLGNDEQLNTQKIAQGYLEGTESVESGERTIEVLDCYIPKGWKKYFEKTGKQIKNPNCAAQLLDEQSGDRPSGKSNNNALVGESSKGCIPPIRRGTLTPRFDSGGASRFFYCAKAPKSEKGTDNKHPTVKPLKLMQYLCKLTKTPTGGIVLDPFMGSGSTLVAAQLEGRPFIGIELNKDYCKIAERRLNELP